MTRATNQYHVVSRIPGSFSAKSVRSRMDEAKPVTPMPLSWVTYPFDEIAYDKSDPPVNFRLEIGRRMDDDGYVINDSPRIARITYYLSAGTDIPTAAVGPVDYLMPGECKPLGVGPSMTWVVTPQ